MLLKRAKYFVLNRRQQACFSNKPWYETVDFILYKFIVETIKFDWGYLKAFIGFYCHHLEWEHDYKIY